MPAPLAPLKAAQQLAPAAAIQVVVLRPLGAALLLLVAVVATQVPNNRDLIVSDMHAGHLRRLGGQNRAFLMCCTLHG